MRSRLKVGSLFSGIGGIDYAFEQAGFNIVWQVEKDDFCKKVLAKHFPKATRYDDVTTVTDLPHVDVITAGFPCQPFSVAGKKLASEDDRFLIPEMLRVIREVKPSVVFFENVPHFATINNGNEFKGLLTWLAQNGYNAQWQYIRAEDAGAPHRRERWFCVAYKDLPDTNRVCTISTKLGHTEPQRRKRHWTIQQRAISARHTARLSKGSGNRSAGAGLETKSGLGRATYGLSNGVDKHRFTAGRNQPQHEGEAVRVTTKTENRRARIKALGNAGVPQVI